MFLQCPVRRFSIRRMLGPRGNPQARNLFEIVAYLRHAEDVPFEVRSTRAESRSLHDKPSQGRKRAAATFH
jgi:hypothetical protein